jgi:glycosyltransferase involved in cell wall biosynthesis
MAAGCAPVVSALGCFQDFIRAGENGLVFDHRAADPAGELARALARLATTPALRERLRTAAWSTARDYTLAGIAARMLEDFQAISRPPAPAPRAAQAPSNPPVQWLPHRSK